MSVLSSSSSNFTCPVRSKSSLVEITRTLRRMSTPSDCSLRENDDVEGLVHRARNIGCFRSRTCVTRVWRRIDRWKCIVVDSLSLGCCVRIQKLFVLEVVCLRDGADTPLSRFIVAVFKTYMIFDKSIHPAGDQRDHDRSSRRVGTVSCLQVQHNGIITMASDRRT